ncbi:Peptide deformylase [Methylophaga frappieri]|uniref:Peptide deformylase n=1 Tax=Methylophaga frappieri (strain ATCC BAA-2434 / DSM 25690 / JAM7) TaxID=754477 RepID=I1YJI7_METFJ|nr:peptide deformylase [Methylophaga frappieri]AFJ03080.1 Peptide deformylase [Methylophaga frappieri]
MTILNILHYPDPRLRNKAQPVESVNNDVRQLAEDMLETMYDAPGIGLAAIQVDIPLRVIVIDISEDKSAPMILINPEILEKNGQRDFQEGCLSVPEAYETVTRADTIRFQALDLDGNPYEQDAEGLLATCIQHEIDHLDGKLFVDYLSNLKRERIRKKIEKHTKQKL